MSKVVIALLIIWLAILTWHEDYVVSVVNENFDALHARVSLLEDKASRPLHYYYPEYQKLDPKRASLDQWAGVSCEIIDEKTLRDVVAQ